MRRPRHGRYSADKGRVLLAAAPRLPKTVLTWLTALWEVRLTTHLCGSFNPTAAEQARYGELLVGASRRKIAVALVQEPYVGYWRAQAVPGQGHPTVAPRAGPVKAAILILDSDVDVEEDQTLIDENVTAAVVTAGQNWRRVGHFECDKPIGPYLDAREVGLLEARDEQNHPGGDVAWSVWWAVSDDARGTELCDFLDVEGYMYSTKEYPHVRSIQPSLRSTVTVEAAPLYWIERRNGKWSEE
ncbi:hypothetical protein EVAR_48885_1 [Eumeta japonica]|uniref:Uncharacterized protein n=1 Tax=Eumeta variegata TaxID=151549 RepID=A0A4C1YWW0_EUMVA|nr:hypothetical protein EVAR_48885_1 [Eumeta japonica]